MEGGVCPRVRIGVRAALLAGSALIAQPLLAQEVQGVEDIIVTAQKREQNLQTVPISITALSQDAIKANRIQDVRDLNAIAPNLTVRLSGGGAQIPNFTLRGILTSGTAVGTDKGVAVYLDGVYMQAVTGGVFDFADIERIEVLKGPQGTLFGRNATGGAISITTRNPTGVFSARQELSYGNLDQLRSKTRVDLPQIGPFSATMTYLHSEKRGDIRNSGAGTTWDFGPASGGRFGKRTSPKYLGSDNVEAFQGTLKADLIDDLDLIYKFDYSENNFTPNAIGIDYLPPNTLVSALYNLSPNPKTPIAKKRPGAVNNAYSTPSRLEVQGHNFTASWRANDVLTFKNIFAYRKTSVQNVQQQLDGLGGLVNSRILPGGTPAGALAASSGNLALIALNPAAPFVLLGTNTTSTESQYSNEFQVNVDTDWFQVTAGVLYFRHRITAGGDNDTFNQLFATAVAGQQTPQVGTNFVLPGNPGYVRNNVRTVSKAAFVQPEFHLTDRLDFVLGARITKDVKNGFEALPDQAVARASTGRPSPVVSQIRYRSSEASYLVGLNWRPTDNVLAYVKYADGYISGGSLATITFKPERAFSYEGGIKTDLFDRRFRSNLSVFKVDYKAIQYVTSGTLTGVPSSFAFAQAVVSSGDAKAHGFEWENTIVPVNGLTLGANVGYTDFKFKSGTIFPGFVIQSGQPGYQPFQRPKWTGTVSAQYESAPMVSGGHLMIRADGNFRSKILMTSDTALGSGPTAVETPALRAAATTPSQWIVNGRVGLVGVEIGRTKVDLTAWGKNIFDNRNITQFIGLDFGALGAVGSVIYERARTYGLDLTVAL
ncbi:TonB-dependent receptor [Sphingomonas montanisoli]|uniref:TonB-dependent receptor n=1 Tax=Sphingomonas montanisoli TaxID=2606412 RepID=A0A5D9C2E8_9SPHN|nr:TonB-dependent receptor [Sphingomonas montanisoli]TZG25829.1 TonB-dependent receptor [Sphingomonas montanisoli]